MFRLPWFLFVVGGLTAGGGTAVGVVIALHSAGPTEDVASTPTVPALTTVDALPAPPNGYAWYISPARRSAGNSYYRFAFQYPAGWIDVYPSNSTVGGRSTRVGFGSQIRPDAIVTPPQQLVVGTRAEPHELNPAEFVPLPMDPDCRCQLLPTPEACSPIPAGQYSQSAFTWKTHAFTCPWEVVDEMKRSLPPITVRGHAAETQAGDLFVSIVAFRPIDEPDVKAVMEQAMSSFVLLAVIQPVPKASPPPVPTPPSLPLPTQGYAWYVTPPDAGYGSAPYAVQVPADFAGPPGPYMSNPINFSPQDAEANWPYPAVPQLITQETPVGYAFKHPFLWNVGRQGGGGCSGDMSAEGLTPSSQYVSEGYTWDVYFFTCHQENANYPPGVTYDARAAETVVGPYIFGIVAIEPPGSGAMQEAFQRALSSFTVLVRLPSPPPPPEGATPLPLPPSGFAWHTKQLRDFGLPDYAVQIPTGWTVQGQAFNPQRFAPGDNVPNLHIQVMPEVGEHLFSLQLIEDCAQLEPPGSFVGESVTWDVYHFGCDSSSDQSTGQLSEFRAAEARVGGYILSLVAQEPPRSNAAKAPFEKALVSFTLR